MRGSPLARLLLLIYLLLVAYASLYPLAGWRNHGASPLEFLSAPWPRHVVPFDVAADFVGYAVLGLLAVLAWRGRLRAGQTLAAATAAGLALSVALEAAQTYLPARVASNVDVLCNVAGAFAGGLAGLAVAPLAPALHGWRARLFLPGALSDLGVALLGLWLFMQLNPAMLLFGGGDLRNLIAGPSGPGARAPEFFAAIETITAGANLAAVALLVSAIVAPGAPVRRLLLALVAAALAVKTLAFTIILRAQDSFAWLTPGALRGLALGLALALLAVALPRVARMALAAVLLATAAVLVNHAPPNPYLAESLRVWHQGHFLNFNGLTRLVAMLWPFAAVGYLIVLAARRRDEGLL